VKKLIIGLLLIVLVLVPVACTSSVDIFFPVQKSGFDQMDALLEGNLELVDSWLRAESLDSSYLLIWPYGFSVRGEGEEIQVLDGDGQVVAVVGESIKVGGGESTAEIVEKYIGKSLPDDCEGPFWIVSEVVEKV
jgi:hypothetical protein